VKKKVINKGHFVENDNMGRDNESIGIMA